jgi:hypothetical protein
MRLCGVQNISGHGEKREKCNHAATSHPVHRLSLLYQIVCAGPMHLNFCLNQ